MIRSRLFRKVLLLTILILGIVCALVAAAAAWMAVSQHENELLNRAAVISETIIGSRPELFAGREGAAIKPLIEQLPSIEGVRYAFVASPQGQVIAHTFASPFPVVLQDALRTAPHLQKGHSGRPVVQEVTLDGFGRVLNVTTPVLNKSAGTLSLGMDPAVLRPAIRNTVSTILLVALAVFLSSSLGVLLYIRRIAGPLDGLTRYADQLANSRYRTPFTARPPDELGDLALTLEELARRIDQLLSSRTGEIEAATRDLKEALSYLTVVLDSLGEGLLVSSENGRVILYNPALEIMLGREGVDLTGRLVEDVVGHDLDTLVRQSIRSSPPLRGAGHNHQAVRLELELTGSGSTAIPAELVASLPGQGEKIGLVCIVRDVTKRKASESQMLARHEDLERRLLLQTEELSMTNLMLKRQVAKKEAAENALAAEKELLAVTLRSIGDGVMAMDTRSKVMLMNTVAEDLTGWDQDEARGRELQEVFPIVDVDTKSPLPGPQLQVSEQGACIELPENGVLLTRDQREIEIEDCLAPIYDSRNEIIGSVLVFRDVSERRQREFERLRSEKLESLGVLAGGIAHDFNNILTAILNNIILARLDSSNAEGVRGKLTEAEGATMRAKQLTQQLLTFSKGGMPVRESTSIGDLIMDSATFSLRGSNVRCTFSIQEDLWPANVDYGQIVQVVDNLVINADQAMPNGGEIHIRVENLEVGDGSGLPLFPGRYVQISVIDHGVGIPENLHQQIFDPYFTTKDTGNGLGLATAYSIVKNHGGHLEVDSKPGDGATFRLQLPAAGAAPEQQSAEPQATPAGQGKILVMDDEPSVRDILKETLDYLGYQPDFAPDGQKAIDLYTRHLQEGRPFDAVIMDLTIPGGMGGKEAIKELLRIDPHVRAIVSSGYSQDPVMAHYERHGFKNVLMKPYTVDEVGRKLHAVLGKE